MAQSSKNLSLFPGNARSPAADRPVPRSAAALTKARDSRLWLAVCLHDLIAEAVRLADSDEPAVIADEDAAQVVAASPAARALGIEVGSTLTAALAMTDRLRIEPRDAAREQRALRSLAIWARTLTPTLRIVEPNALLLEIRGSLRLFGGVAQIKAVVQAQLLRRGLSARMSLAPSAQAATWLAREIDCEVAEESELQRALRGLPLHVTGWPQPLQQRLAEMGIGCIGDLLRLPRDGLILRIGKARVQELDRAAGRAFEERAVTALPERWGRSVELPAETSDKGMLIEACEMLLDQLVDELRQRQKQIRRFAVRFFHLRREASRETFELLAATYDKQRLLDLLADRFERLVLPAPVISLELSAGELHDFFAATPALFERAHRQADDTGMIERLRERCGPKSVYGVVLAEDHRPESAWSMQLQQAPADTHPSPWAGARPLWLLPQPRPCDPANVQMELGPERIESGWWDGHSVSRDYYVAGRGSGERVWVYFDHRERRWYLHGVFG